MVAYLVRGGRPGFEERIRKYCAGHPVGGKHPRRLTDVIANSRSPLMLDYTPVGKMFFEGSGRLLASGVSVLPCHPRADARIAVEAYPALVARNFVSRPSYKSDTRRKQTSAHAERRRQIVAGLRTQRFRQIYGFSVVAPRQLWRECVADPTGDLLDAVLCSVQATWGCHKRKAKYGIPADADKLEGWIVDPQMTRWISSRSARTPG